MQKHAFFAWILRYRKARSITKPLLVMKLTTAIIIACMLNASANGISQTVTFSGKNVPLEEVISAVEKQTNIFFFYEAGLLRKAAPITIHAVRSPLKSFLDELFKKQPLNFYLENKLVIITGKTPHAAIAKPGSGAAEEAPPPVLIRGRVVNENGEPVEASVVIKGSSGGTTTNGQGYFELTLPSEKAVLVISGIGIETREIGVDGAAQQMYNIAVETRITEVQEAIVTGYSSQRKRDIIGSVAVVDVKALKSIPAGSALQALQGQASGVNIISSGSPGHASNIRIRGVTSFGNTNPLVLIDGVQGSLNDVASDDVESIQVLKDAGAAAIYGVRGANGVIVVTTKKGRSGRAQTTYDSYYGVQTPVAKVGRDMMNLDEFMGYYNTLNPGNPIFANGVPDYMWRGPNGSGVAKAGDPAVDPAKYFKDPANPSNNYLIQEFNKAGTDWSGEMFRPALMMNHNLSTTGGTDRLNYMVSFGYMNQQGTLLNTHMKRYSVRVNTEYKLRDNIRIGENLYAFYRDNPQENPNHPYMSINATRGMLPFIPVYDIMGNWGGGYAGPNLGTNGNPVALRSGAANDRSREIVLAGNVFAEIDLMKGLTLRTSFGGNVNTFYRQTFTTANYFHAEQFNNPNGLAENSGYSSLLMWTNTLTYKKTLDRHSFAALLGTEAITMDSRTQSGSRQNYYSEDYNYLILGNGTQNMQNSSAAGEDAFYSVFGKVDYSYDDRYLLGLTLRRDGSSRFGPQSRYGVFPSITAGWRLSSEKFMLNAQWISDLKLRASYGVLGNADNVSITNSATLFSQAFINSYYDINGTSTGIVQGFIPSTIANPSAGWEKNIVSNIGIDASLFNNKLDLSFEYFDKSIEGLLFALPLPTSIAGTATTPTVNIGDIKNNGIDFSATYHARLGIDMRLDIGGNITAYKNLIKNIPGGYFDPQWTPRNSVRNQEGQAVGAFFGYDIVGIFQDADEVSKAPTQDGAEPGRFRYRDVDGNGVINTNDRTFIGNPNPDFVYGINIGFSFKKFDLGAIFYGSQGNDILNDASGLTNFAGGLGNKSKKLLDAWTPGNTTTTVPKLEQAPSFSTTNVMNTYLLEDGSYLRLRSLVLGYNFDVSGLKKAGINRLRVYVQGANLFTITKYSGSDPEITSYRNQTFGIDEGYYPNSRNFLFGLNVGF